MNSGISSAIYLDAGYFDNPVNNGQYNIHVYQNIIENPSTLGITVASEMGNSTRDIYIYNNLIYDLNNSQGPGIKIADHTDEQSTSRGLIENIHIYNNTVYGRAQQGIYVNTTYLKNIIIRNNISVNDWIPIKIKDNVGIDEQEVVIENNLSFGSIYNGDFGINAVLADPQFIDINNADFRLKPNSPAIDNGINTGFPSSDLINTARPRGNGYNIGAYEFVPQ